MKTLLLLGLWSVPSMQLSWLPRDASWNLLLAEARTLPPDQRMTRLAQLTQFDLDFMQTIRLDRALETLRKESGLHAGCCAPIKLAILGSSTLKHLVPSIRVGALRRGVPITVFEGEYGSYFHELSAGSAELDAFSPDVVMLALDARHMIQLGAAGALHRLTECWQLIKTRYSAAVIQQTVMPTAYPLLGNNEHMHPESAQSIVRQINYEIRERAVAHDVQLLALDNWVQNEGLDKWFDIGLWLHSKQEVHPGAAPLYGDQVGRLLAAMRGLSRKCLVLDLDNTLWGGVIGDDGIEGIVLGQGNATGEAYIDFQQYAKSLSRRGVLLAVCSKNTESIAKNAFEHHPEMVLRLNDISCFVSNWEDKASNMRMIASTLNIGLDSLVLADDNPFERNLIRRELPEVAVPELPEDPARYALTIASAGYFESTTILQEDRDRTDLYALQAKRAMLQEQATDMNAYLASLGMQLHWSPFDRVGMQRIAQLVNKSNQFNLTTRRYLPEEIVNLIDAPGTITLQLRLTDNFGDNGMIAVVIGHAREDRLEVDTWLMSCRVLARQVEDATLNLVVDCARDLGLRRIVGFYLPTAKNGMVRDHYQKMGFQLSSQTDDGNSIWSLEVESYTQRQTFIDVIDVRSEIAEAHR